MTDLIQRLTDATGNERGLFEEAFDVVFPARNEWQWEQTVCRFTAMLDAEAWTSAAEMLVPVGCSYDLISGREVPDGDWLCFVGSGKGEGRSMARAATPALSLLIAALKAGGNDAE